MPEPIAGLPPHFKQDDPRLFFPVGITPSGGFSLWPSDWAQKLSDALREAARAASGINGSELVDLETFTVTGAILGINLQIDPNLNRSVSGVRYYNSGTKTIALRIRLGADVTTTGEILLAPGRNQQILRHTGFEARTPESMPSFLQVEKYA